MHTVDVFADNKGPTRLASGALDHEDFGWDAALAPDSHHEYVTDLNIRLPSAGHAVVRSCPRALELA